MTNLEIGLLVITVVQTGFLLFFAHCNKEIIQENDNYHKYVDKLEAERINLSKQSKMSNDVLAVLHDMKNGGVMLHVERIDKNDIFFHNGGQYR